MKSFPIRIRLTAWYSLILAASLFIFGALAFVAMRHSVRATVDADLRERLMGVQEVIAVTAPEGLAELKDEIREFAIVRAGGDLLRVADAQGKIIYDSFGPDTPRAVRRKYPGAPTFTERLRNNQFRVLSETIEAAGSRYQVQIAISTERFDEAFDRFRLILLLAAPLFLLAAALGGYWLSRRALSPVDEITRTARSIGAQNLAARLRVPHTGDELERLADTLNGMLARLDAAFQRITKFTADASHELRTPVSVMRTSAEVVLRKPRTEREYKEALGLILHEAEKTSQLIEQLLMLARADSGPASIVRSRVNLIDAFQRACREACILAEAKQLKFSHTAPDSPIWVLGESRSIERLFLILLDNAVKYTPSGGNIEATLKSQDGLAIAEVRDSGIGIAAEDIPHIFERFYRADRARSRETGGSGLGLAIGHWIAEAHGADIRVDSQPGGGSSFSVRMPLATDYSTETKTT